MGGYTHTSSEKSTAQQGGSNDVAAAPQPFTLGQRLGNQGLGQLLRSRRLQAKLTVSNPNDVYEQEADRVADQVMRMADPQHRPVSNTALSLQRKCNSCEEELRRSPESPAVPTVDAATEQSIGSLSGRGSPLPQSVRAFMEPRFNADFSAVRVHTDSNAHSLARAVDAKAFTVGNNVVFGAGHFTPQTDDGKRLLAHELAHTIQQLGPAPRIARSPDTQNVLRLSSTGETVTVERLIVWAIAQNRPMAELILEVGGSRTFSGSVEVRKLAAEALRTANEVLLIEEARKDAEAARKFAAERARRHRWLAGHGTIGDNVLQRAGGPRLTEGGVVFFETYDLQGGLIWQSYPNADAYGDSIRKQLEEIDRRCHSLAERVVEYIKLDERNVDEAREEAAWYQRPGLALPGVRMGFSKVALVSGEIAVKFAGAARVTARAALRELARNQGTPAGEGLNEARVLLLQATHSLQAMLRTREGEDEASLGHLNSYSQAGDYAAIGMTAPLQIFLSLAKNATVRAARMHSDPSAEFDFSSFAKDTVITIGSVKLERWLAGANPGVVRGVGAGLATNQIAKVAQTGDMAQAWNFDAFEVGLATAGPAYARLRARAGQPEMASAREFGASMPATGTTDPNATAQPNFLSQGAASASPPTYEQRLLAWSQNQPAPTDGLGSSMNASASGASNSSLSTASGATPVVSSNQAGFVTHPEQGSAGSQGKKVTKGKRGRKSKKAKKAKVIEGFWRADESAPKPSADETTTVVAGFVGEPAKVPWSAELDPPLPPRKVGFKSAADWPEIRHRGGNNWTVGEYTLLATRQRQGNVFHWNISHVGHAAGATPSMRSFVECLFADAAHSGANLLRITGAKLDPQFTKQLALDVEQNYNGAVRRENGGTVEILIPVSQTPGGAAQSYRDRTYKPVYDDLGTVAPGNRPVASAGNGRIGDPPEMRPESGSDPAAPAKSSDGMPKDVATHPDGSRPPPPLPDLSGPNADIHLAVYHSRLAAHDKIGDGLLPAPEMPGELAAYISRIQPPKGKPYHLHPFSMAGMCGVGRQQVALSLLCSGVPAEQIYLIQVGHIPGVQARHALTVYKKPDGIYLIDTTFAQFDRRGNPRLDDLFASPAGSKLLRDLRRDAFTPLTDDSADLYLRMVNDAREVPGVSAATFLPDSGNLAKNPRLLENLAKDASILENG